MNRVMTIVVEGLVKRYGEKVAVKDVSFTVEPGHIFGLIGPNGSGKTTTLRILAGLIRSDEGRVRILGREPAKVLSKMGCVFEFPNLYPYLTGYDNIRLLIPRSNPSNEYISTAARELDIEYALNRKVKSYSLGMKQRLIIAAMLIKNPDVWILDEPTTGLDAEGSEVLHSLLRKEAEKGKTIILSSHALNGIETWITDFGIIKHGVLIQSGTIEDFVQTSPKRLTLLYSLDKVQYAASVLSTLGIQNVFHDNPPRLVIDDTHSYAVTERLLQELSAKELLPLEYRWEHTSFSDFYLKQVSGGADS
ncbi:ABC transporter ATP-binding protein [Alicyclobacillus fructus]|uniref:ABC transporter ATP-binding protein n=1 Tax=Alicyclobacillus fructus TaxID=2816082 RepID=UPI001A8D4F09|nr:ABC transporter ATP-binding protein [Alicyclobacillus fructus]